MLVSNTTLISPQTVSRFYTNLPTHSSLTFYLYPVTAAVVLPLFFYDFQINDIIDTLTMIFIYINFVTNRHTI